MMADTLYEWCIRCVCCQKRVSCVMLCIYVYYGEKKRVKDISIVKLTIAVFAAAINRVICIRKRFFYT